MVTLAIDTRGLTRRMEEFHDALIGRGQMGDAATIVEDEARLALKQIITLTPPKGLGQDARKVGEGAVARDLRKLFTPIGDELLNAVGSKHGVANIDAWFTTANGTKEHIQWDRIDPTGAGMRDWHNRNRDSRGRAYKRVRDKEGVWYSPYVVSKDDFKAYWLRVKSHVGRRKAAWGVSFKDLGGRLQGWVEAHVAGARGRVKKNLTGTRPFVTVGNSSPGIAGDAHIVSSAMRIRSQAIGRRIKLVLSGYSKDMKARIAIAKQERRKVDVSL